MSADLINLEVARQANRGRIWPPSPAQPVHLKEFVSREFCKELAGELLASGEWERSHYLVFPREGRVRSVSANEFETLADDTTAIRHGSLSTISARTLRASSSRFRQLRSSLLDSELRRAFSEMMGVEVTPATDLIASMFSERDFLAPHQDTFPDWVSSFVIYLTDTSSCRGGELSFYNGTSEHLVSVEAGDAVFIPISQQFNHEVRRVDEGRRLSLNFHLKLAK